MTLIEVMVVVVLASLVTGTVATLLLALIKTDRAMRQFDLETERQAEFVETLHTDIRRASNVSLAAETMLVVIEPNERESRYELIAGGCRRVVSDAGVSKPQADFFAIGPAAAWSLKNGPVGRRPLYIVTLYRSARTADRDIPKVPLMVYAAFGADLPAEQ